MCLQYFMCITYQLTMHSSLCLYCTIIGNSIKAHTNQWASYLFCIYAQQHWSVTRNNGCLPFTWANRSVYGLGKWYAKFRTGKFSSGIAFTICTDQFHLTENGREGLKLVSKMALRKWNTNFRLEYFVRKNRTTFSDVPLLPEIFRWEDPKSRVPLTFEPDFPENSCKW